MKKLILKLFTALFLIPASVVGAIFGLDRQGFFNLDQIQITVVNQDINSHYLQPLVAELNLNLEKQRGKSLWHLDLPQVSKSMQKMKWIESTIVSRNWPAKLYVYVQPKRVKLLYLTKSGDAFPIVEDGSFLSKVSMKTAPDVTLLEGAIFENSLEMRKKAVKVISEIPRQGKFSNQKVSELRFDPKEGFWATLIQSGIKVKIGEENILLKAARVSQVLEYLETRELEARVIDANLSKKVLVRLRKDP